MKLLGLKALKKDSTANKVKKFSRFAILGTDFYSIDMLMQLAKKFGEDEISFIAENELVIDQLFFQGPSLIRGEANTQAIEKLCEKETYIKVDGPASFYRDSQFYKFGGKKKSMPLLFNEDFFTTQNSAYIDTDLIITDDHKNFFNEELQKFLEVKRLIKIEKISETDLVERANWRLTFGDETTIECEYLVWGRRPYEFFEYFAAKPTLSAEFIQFCEQTKENFGLSISFESDIEITDKTETIFLPQSQTHEWGHFIGEFLPYNTEKKCQKFRFYTFVEENSSSEEDVGKKIRALKSTLKRLFPLFSKAKIEEKILVGNHIPCLNFDTEIDNKTIEEFEKLLIVGPSAPLDGSALALIGDDNFAYPEDELLSYCRGKLSVESSLKSFS